jgi:hypothetical protein
MTSDQGKRTNSLGFARSDCHTCSSLGDKCDRRRPQCSTCLDQSRCCGGFATALSWDARRMVNSLSSASGPVASAACSGSSKQFRFVKGTTSQKRRRKEAKTRSTEQEDPSAATRDISLRATGQELENPGHHQNCDDFADFGKLTNPCLGLYSLVDLKIPKRHFYPIISLYLRLYFPMLSLHQHMIPGPQLR